MRKKIIIISLVILAVVCLIAYAINRFFFSIQGIKGQVILEQSTSSDGKYTVTSYLNNGGATTDFAVLCQVKNNKTNKTKNIYWQYHCETARIEWIDNKKVKINDITLDVTKDIYDYRDYLK